MRGQTTYFCPATWLRCPMLFRPFLLLRIAFVREGKLDYHGLLNMVVVLVLLVLLLVWLWQIGLDLVRSSQPRRRVGGWLLLAVAATFAVGLVGFVYWESQMVWSLLD
jgi:hypothetical protein